MLLPPSSALLLVASLLTPLACADGLYTKKSPVLQLDAKSYDRHISNSNYTSIVEFYAPWCGHCQNLKPAYEKAAKNLDGLAKVAAVNCDDDANKPLCSRLGVQGFPTLKIMTPSKKPGTPKVEDYMGARSAKAIVDEVVTRIPNHVKRVTDKDLDEWLAQDEEAPKALLFTEKGTTTPLIRAVAIDFLGSIKVGQIRNKETAAVEKFGVKEFPSLVLLPGGGKEPVPYTGELNKKALVEFLSQAAAPNPDPAPASAKAKAKSSSKSSKSSKSSSTAEEKEAKSTESPEPESTPDTSESQEKRAAQPSPPSLESLATPEALKAACLSPKSSTCVLAFVQAEEPSDSVKDALASLAEIAHKHAQRNSKLFPVYNVPASNSDSEALVKKLGLSEHGKELEVVAVNGRRGWMKRFDPSESADYSLVKLDAWIDSIKLGEGAKSKIPEGVVVSEEDVKKESDGHDEL